MQGQHDGHDGREALMWGASERVGWFRFFFDDERWEWSPQVAHMHGYPPESVNPTTELVLSHKHPDDYRQIADTLALIRQTRQAFSSRHRIRDVQGAVHHVVVVGDQLRNGDGSVVGTHGFYVDITPAEEARQDHLTAEVEKITKSRASIEQAKGMLMAIYGIDGDAAFDLLKWRSQETNVRLRPLAEQIVSDFSAVAHDEALPARSVYDNLLLTAQDRVENGT
jgi:PAS domain S-box-containing protein